MRFHVEAKAFRDTLSLAGLAVRRSTAPIMESVLIEAKDNRLRIVGSCHQIEAHAKCEAAVSEAGRACVNFADLRGIFSAAKSTVSVSMSDAGLLIEGDGLRAVMPTLEGAFPLIAKEDGGSEIGGGVEALAALAPFCATGVIVPERFEGVCFSKSGAMASDDRAFATHPAQGGEGQIVHASVHSIAKKVGGRLFLGEKQWRIEAEGFAAIGPLVGAEFPNIDGIVNRQRIELISCYADELLAALTQATVGSAQWVVLASDGAKATLSGDKFKGGVSESQSGVDGPSVAFSVVVAVDLLKKCLAPFAGQTLNISASGEVIFIKALGGHMRAVLMALRDHRNNLPAIEEAAA